jgi:hypothetical protein
MAYRRAIEIEGKYGVQTAFPAAFVIRKGGHACDKHTADLILTRAIEELEGPPYGAEIVALPAVMTYCDDIGA